MTRDEAIAKIRKLVDRARRDGGREGRLARQMARSLMREYGITAADLEVARPPRVKLERRPGPPPKRIPIKVKIGDFEIRLKL